MTQRDPFTDDIAVRSIAAGDYTGWFEHLYNAGVAGVAEMPWNRRDPHPLLVEWLRGRTGRDRRAVAVGCGLGADAEHVASLGYRTVGFDIARTAVNQARARHPRSQVTYQVADLLDPPQEWYRAFDLVVEVMTVQSLPDPVRRNAILNVSKFVGPGGALLVIAARDRTPGVHTGRPPWPLTSNEIASFNADGLTAVRIEELTDPRAARPRWRAEFHRPHQTPPAP